MPDTIEQVVPAFDPKTFTANRNELERSQRTGEEPKFIEPKVPEVKAEPAKVDAKTEEKAKEDRFSTLPRFARREIERAREEAAEERGRRKAIEEHIASLKSGANTEETKVEAPSAPVRANYASDAEFYEARTEYVAEKKVETALAAEREERERQIAEELRFSQNKAAADLLPDWEDVAKLARGEAEDEDGNKIPGINIQSKLILTLLEKTENTAFVLYHFAKHPDELRKLDDMASNPWLQSKAFWRLEERVEKLYTANTTTNKAAGASAGETEKGTPKEERTSPEKTEQVRAAAERTSAKPKPSMEVAAMGGSAVPDEPKPGSKEWVLKRNQNEFHR